MLNVDDITDLSVAKQVAQLALAENAHLHKRIAALAEEISALRGDKAPEQLALELSWLEQRIAGLQRQLFAASSERRPRPVADADEATSKQEREPGVGPRVQRKLPRLRVEHHMPESERLCPCCDKPMVEWTGQAEETEEVDVVERRFVLKKHVRQKYRCKCRSAPKTAPGPVRMPGGGRYSLDFAIEVADAKWHQHNPLERQVRYMRTEGLDVTASTLWEQSERLARLLTPAYDKLLAHVTQAPLLHADETPWRMLKKPRRKHWVWCLGTYDAVYYHIDPSRGAQVLEGLIGGYEGVIVADGYRAYETAAKALSGKVDIAICWAHARRKFIEAEDNDPAAKEAVDLMGKLFLIERELPTWWAITDPSLRRGVLAQIRETRQARSAPIVEELAAWARSQRALPKSSMGKALGYLNTYWDGLGRFLDDPLVPMTNNFAERSLRGIVVGRKNHYGSKSVRGTEVAAIFYSLIESAKLCRVQPKAYLRAAAHAAIAGEPVLLPNQMR